MWEEIIKIWNWDHHIPLGVCGFLDSFMFGCKILCGTHQTLPDHWELQCVINLVGLGEKLELWPEPGRNMKDVWAAMVKDANYNCHFLNQKLSVQPKNWFKQKNCSVVHPGDPLKLSLPQGATLKDTTRLNPQTSIKTTFWTFENPVYTVVRCWLHHTEDFVNKKEPAKSHLSLGGPTLAVPVSCWVGGVQYWKTNFEEWSVVLPNVGKTCFYCYFFNYSSFGFS